MNALQWLEQCFASAIDTVDESPLWATLCGEIVQDHRLSDRARVSIYQNNTRMACYNALLQIYPVCLAILGERCFRTLARDYVEVFPSQQTDLNLYGENFHQILQRALNRPAFAGMNYLPDLAQFEWHWHAIYSAADDTAFDATAFAQDASTDAQNVCFLSSASLRLLDTRFPILTLWQQHKQGTGNGVVSPVAEPLVLWREGFQCQAVVVDERNFTLLRALCAGRTLGQMVDAGLATERLGDFIARGWVVGHQCHRRVRLASA